MQLSHVTRTRVTERLERAAKFPVTLLVAPAGFGKSIAMRDFVETMRLDAIRFNVQREDGTLLAFVRSLSESLQSVAPSALAAFPSMQQRILAAEEPVRVLSDWFAEHLKRAVCTIVIDDLHYAAADPASIALISDVIERTSERIKWIIAARSDMGLPIATWVAYGRMDLPVGEDELRFTMDEALAAADENEAELDPKEIESLRQLTEGWAVALTIALRTRTHSRDLLSASFGTREMVYRYLAEQVFAGLSEAQRAFALASCVFSAFDIGIAQALGASHEFVTELRAKVAFISELTPGDYRYHDLFREFLEAELRRSGENEWTHAICRAGEILQSRGDDAGALSMFTKAKDVRRILAVVGNSGFSLFERGQSEQLALALDLVPESELHTSAAGLGLKAMLEAARGRFPLAERRFIAAIDAARADPDLQIALVGRYAIELVRQDRDCIRFLEPYATNTGLRETDRVPLLGTLATAYARASRYEDAFSTIERAIESADPSMDPEMLSRLYQQAAFVFHGGPSIERTRTYASTAIELALAHNLYEVAARAYSVLFTVVYNEEDDPIACLSILDKLEECAKKGASNHARIFALIAAYEIEAERGDDVALDRLDNALREQEGSLPRARAQAILPASALRATWAGDFFRALQLLDGTMSGLADDRRALRAAEIALYAFSAGSSEAATAAYQTAIEILDGNGHGHVRRLIRARSLLALAELVRGHSSGAHRHILEAERRLAPQMHRLRTLVHAVRTVYRVQLGQLDPAALASALERLRANHFGGMARLFEALPIEGEQGAAYAALTAAEREILQMLSRGASTKDVASKTGRSPHTVDTHIRSICRKLNCSGRREAVALATSQGWVQT